MLIVTTPYGLSALMAAVKAYLVTAPGYTVKLFQNNMNPNPQSVLADFTEATFDGYTAITLTALVGPDRDVTGGFRLYNQLGWQQSGSVTPNVIYGFYVVDHTAALIAAYRFAAPVAMNDQYSSLSFMLEWLLGPNGISGTSEPN
jgi:hypothetical protein